MVCKISFLFFYSELIHGSLCVYFTGVEHYRGEVSLVGAVGEVLCLEADGAALGEGCSVSTFEAAVPV